MLQVNNLKKSACTRLLIFLLLLSSSVGATATADRVVVTSGRVVYDAFGRAVATYHPTVDTDSVYDFIAAIDTVDPTCTTYDVLDRPVRVIYPDGTETNTTYRVEGHALVTHVTDALGNATETHVSGSGRTLKSIQYDGSEQIVTQFTYDGIGRLVEVLDADTNVTVSEYDMGDRRVRVSHPASGETTFSYDALGNVLKRQTANLRDSALFIEYTYDHGRLISVKYPEHPENNVRYYYGGANDQDNAKGRLCLRLDATGGEQYAYDDMGNVKETVRTVTVPNEDVGTFKTEFEYDSFGKLLSLTYPDGEKVCYWYDGSGQLTEVYVKERNKGYRYVEEIGYDKFGDRVYMRYGNGAETEYAYNDGMRRLDSLSLASPHTTLKRIYGYDDVGNITSVTNSGTGLLHDSPVSHTYVYDNLYRLTEAYGTTGSAQTGYDLSMSYDKMYRITGKTQGIRQTGIQFAGTLNAGYDLSYAYDRTPGRRFRMSSVSDVNYRTVGAPEDGDYIDEEHFYEYDPNGNILHVNTGRWKRDGVERELSREEKFRWDEENRLMAISQDGYVSNYWYDGDGERVIKEHGGNQAVFVNSEQDGVLTDTRQFTVYPSAYLTVHNGSWYTKHIYIGSERIASRMGTMLVDELSETFEANAILAGENVLEEIDYDGKCDTLARVMRSNYAYFDLPYNGENRHGDEMVSTPPRSGDPGILSAGGARHYWMLADADAADADSEGGGPSRGPRRAENVNYNGNRYFYHSDHLGSSSLITDASGNVTQQLDYLPYGEVFLEKRANVDYSTPYKFNGKELDEETGLYYYGARYMNPRLSIWYGCDPLQEKYPNISSYAYCADNPIVLFDKKGYEPTEEEAVRIAAHVYGDRTDDILIGGWRVSKTNFGIKLNDGSGLNSLVYERVVKNRVTEYVYATAGTVDEQDWKENFKQPFGLSQQYHNAANNAKKLSNILKNKELNYVGHSLGGGEAALNSLLTYGEGKGRKAFTFNAAGVSNATKIKEGSLMTPFKSENSIEAYILRTDPLNIAQDASLLIPDVNGKRHYLLPKDIRSVYNGHDRDSLLKSFGVSNPEKYHKQK